MRVCVLLSTCNRCDELRLLLDAMKTRGLADGDGGARNRQQLE
jgi:hypothetical protein